MKSEWRETYPMRAEHSKPMAITVNVEERDGLII